MYDDFDDDFEEESYLPPVEPQVSVPPQPAPQVPVKVPASPPTALGQPQSSARIGFGLLTVATGAAIGLKYGGGFGSLAGALFAGAGINAIRAAALFRHGTPEDDREATISGTYAVASTALGALVWAKLTNKNTATATPNPTKKEKTEQTLCGIRPVGP